MKKPDIEILGEYAEGFYNGVFVNGDLLCLCHYDEKSDAIRSMIDALIEARRAIYNASAESFGSAVMEVDGKTIPYPLKDELLNEIDKALKKAGVNMEEG